MSKRFNPYEKHYGLVKPLIDFGRTIDGYGIDPAILHLVKIRASQINGCAICLDLHVKDARKDGETETRMLMLDAWRETTLYNDRERAALAWTEALTRLADTHAPDDVYEVVRAVFTEEEMVALTMTVGVINTFNKIGVGFRVPPIQQQRVKAA